MRALALRAITLVAALAAPLSMRADETCNCTKVPFKPDPPCASTCSALFLAVSDTSDLSGLFLLSHQISRKIGERPAASRPTSVEGYALYLSQGQLAELTTKSSALPDHARAELSERVRAKGGDVEKIPSSIETWK